MEIFNQLMLKNQEFEKELIKINHYSTLSINIHFYIGELDLISSNLKEISNKSLFLNYHIN
jgi:hypothetical protein